VTSPLDRRRGDQQEADRDERRASERRRAAGRRDLDTLLDVTRRLMTVTDLDALLRLIAEATIEMVGAERATIYIVDRDRQEFWSRVATGSGVGEIRFPLGVGIAGTVAKTGETISIPDAYADPRFNPERIQDAESSDPRHDQSRRHGHRGVPGDQQAERPLLGG